MSETQTESGQVRFDFDTLLANANGMAVVINHKERASQSLKSGIKRNLVMLKDQLIQRIKTLKDPVTDEVVGYKAFVEVIAPQNEELFNKSLAIANDEELDMEDREEALNMCGRLLMQYTLKPEDDDLYAKQAVDLHIKESYSKSGLHWSINRITPAVLPAFDLVNNNRSAINSAQPIAEDADVDDEPSDEQSDKPSEKQVVNKSSKKTDKQEETENAEDTDAF